MMVFSGDLRLDGWMFFSIIIYFAFGSCLGLGWEMGWLVQADIYIYIIYIYTKIIEKHD